MQTAEGIRPSSRTWGESLWVERDLLPSIEATMLALIAAAPGPPPDEVRGLVIPLRQEVSLRPPDGGGLVA